MSGKKVLVVFHSSSGNTKKVGQAIAERLSAAVEEIQEVNPRPVDIRGKGLRNFLNMGFVVFHALTNRTVPIKAAQHDPADYDLVVIGTPVYASSLSAPVRAYLRQYSSRCKEVAFFSTGLDPNPAPRVFQQMEQVCDKTPKAVYAFQAQRILAEDFPSQLQEFISRL
nr:NAD(P)H-dependent oxidoreductase [Chloroflexota bacterium]